MSETFEHGGNIFAIARQMGVSAGEILDFSASINPLGTVPDLYDAISTAFEQIIHYPETDAPELRQALSRWHCLPQESISVANGSTELIYLLPGLVKGKRALVVAPAFSEYSKALAREKWTVDYHILKHDDCFELNLELLQQQLNKGYDLLILCNPGNPTGRLYQREEIKNLAELCAKNSVFLVLDEAFMDFCEENSATAMAAQNSQMLVLRSMTKFYALPGLRLGWAVGTPSTISRLSALKEPWSVNCLAKAAGIASLADKQYTALTVKMITCWRNELAEGLASLPGCTVFPSAANYLLLKLPTAMAGKLASSLSRQKILVRDCANFKGLDGHFLRLAVRKGEDNRLLLDALQAMLKAT
ncbi:MAG: threonine-phosphate decarboxylase CobD [Trichlorobacter sp.]|nr:threonine-phosphate decarboxylase CobD [Trichlorobacter sp.]